MDWKEQVLRNKTIPLMKVLWRNHLIEDVTWEREDKIREKHPYFFHTKGMLYS